MTCHNQKYMLNVCWAYNCNYIPWIEVYIFISSNLNHVDSGGDIELKSAVVEDASARGTNIEPLLTTLPALLPPSNVYTPGVSITYYMMVDIINWLTCICYQPDTLVARPSTLNINTKCWKIFFILGLKLVTSIKRLSSPFLFCSFFLVKSFNNVL